MAIRNLYTKGHSYVQVHRHFLYRLSSCRGLLFGFVRTSNRHHYRSNGDYSARYCRAPIGIYSYIDACGYARSGRRAHNGAGAHEYADTRAYKRAAADCRARCSRNSHNRRYGRGD